MGHPITLTFLRDTRHGGSAGQPARAAASLASFINAAEHSIDIAIYDFRLSDQLGGVVVDALVATAERGLTVRIGYDAGKPAAADAATFARLEADPAPPGTAEWVTSHFDGTKVTTKAIVAGSHLMHSKYVIRDAGAGADNAAVWTGSSNFTDDAWTLQENNIVRLYSSTVAHAYLADFVQMWNAGAISGTGLNLGGHLSLGGADVAWDFSPGDGAHIDADLVTQIDAAEERIIIAAMVLTSPTVLAAIVAAIGRGVVVSGIYDAGQMDPIVAEWRKSKSPTSAKALAAWLQVSPLLARKHSTPYQPDSPHDFLHDKVIIADSVVATGSYNFSTNAQHNAENHLRVESAALADRYASQIATLATVYGQA